MRTCGKRSPIDYLLSTATPMSGAPLPIVPGAGTGTAVQAEYHLVKLGDHPLLEYGLFPERLIILSFQACPHPDLSRRIYSSLRTTLKSGSTPNTTRSSASSGSSRDGDSSWPFRKGRRGALLLGGCVDGWGMDRMESIANVCPLGTTESVQAFVSEVKSSSFSFASPMKYQIG